MKYLADSPNDIFVRLGNYADAGLLVRTFRGKQQPPELFGIDVQWADPKDDPKQSLVHLAWAPEQIKGGQSNEGSRLR